MKHLVMILILIPLFLSGCSGASPVMGGTAGSLAAGDLSIPDFEIKVFKSGSTAPLGTGNTGKDGKFQLVQAKGEGPLRLEPGEYVFTLESHGPVSPPLPPAYMNVSKTPLKVNWKADDKSLDLKIPAFK